MNFNLKLNLSKLRKVKYLQKDEEQYICIPVKANQIFNGQKGFYLELTAFELKDRKYNDSHLVKLSVQKKVLESLSEEQKQQLPIIGSLSEFGAFYVKKEDTINENFGDDPKNVKDINEDDLPF